MQYSNKFEDKIEAFQKEIYDKAIDYIDNSVSNRWKNIRDTLLNTVKEFFDRKKVSRKRWLTSFQHKISNQ